jgi:hypothetical protein
VETSPNDIWAQVIAQWLKDRNQSLMGFRPIISTRLPLNTTNDVRTCVAFTRRAFTLSSDHMEIKINELPSERHCIQIAAYAQKGAVRRYDERVQLIFCDQSP